MTPLAPTVAGGAPTQYSVAPALPGGIALDPATGAIAGTPNAVSPATTHTITAANSDGSATFGLLLEVVAAPVIPVAEFVTTAVPAPENAGAVLLVVALSDVAAVDVTIPFSVGGSASGADYTIGASPLSIPAGTLSATIAVTPVSDGAAEPAETVIVTLLAAANADIGPANVATVTISAPIPAPCNLVYPDASIVAGRLAAMTAAVPTVGCGGATSFVVTPPLPAGLIIGAATGAISGTPSVAQGAVDYTVTASNAFGSTTATVTIEVEEPLYEIYGDDPTVSYDPANGIASGAVGILLEEFPSPDQAAYRNVAGYSFGIVIDTAELTVVELDVIEGADQQVLNAGAGADFWNVNVEAAGITVGAIFTLLQVQFLVADVPREIVVVQFDAASGFLLGNATGATVTLPFTDGIGTPPVQRVVSIGGQTAVPVTTPLTITFVP
jgi:hypothetical protein